MLFAAAPLLVVLLIAPAPARAADVVLATADGLTLSLDSATGALTSLTLDSIDVIDRSTAGGLFVRDRQHLTDSPAGNPNEFLNPSLEADVDADGVPDGWISSDAWNTGARLRFSTDAAEGTRSVVVGARAGGTLYQPDIPVLAGTRYLVQAMAKGTASTVLYVVWKTAQGDFLLYEGGRTLPPRAAFSPVHFMVTAPQNAGLADVAIVATSDGDATIDMLRMYPAPPAAWSPGGGSVVATPTGAVQTSTLPALGLQAVATWTARPDRIEVEVVLRDTTGQDRALEAGLVVPVYPRQFWDGLRAVRDITQQTYSQTFAYTWWGRIYNDGPWGTDASVYPFAPVSLGSGLGVALGYDVERGPQDCRFFYSTYTGESLTARFRLGMAPQPTRFPREARYRLSLFRVDGDDAFRSALDRYYRMSGTTFENRMPRVGGWVPWTDPSSIPGASDFGIAMHTWDSEVRADDQASILTLGHLDSFDYWLPLGDFPSRPTTVEALARLQQNATGPVSDPALQSAARSTLVSGVHDAAGTQTLEVVQQPWMPGSGWAAVCSIDPDPEIRDTGSGNWPSRFDLYQAELDSRFARAQTAGGILDGAFFDWFRSWHSDKWNHRRSAFASCDTSPSFDPERLTPALTESFAHWEALSRISTAMRTNGLVTMARDIDIPSFFATSGLDAMGQEVDWLAIADDDQRLGYYRTVAGRKPYMLLLNGDFATLDVTSALSRALFYGLVPSPNWDSAANQSYWTLTAYRERDRPLFRRMMPLFALEHRAGWEPLTHASSSDPTVFLERWGARQSAALLFSALNPGTSPVTTTISIDLGALGLTPAEAAGSRAIELVAAGLVPGVVNGTRLDVTDTLPPASGRLYHVHLGATSPLVLLAVKRAGDVALSWTNAQRTLYEVLASGAPDLSGSAVTLATTPTFVDTGAVARPGSTYYRVE